MRLILQQKFTQFTEAIIQQNLFRSYLLSAELCYVFKPSFLPSDFCKIKATWRQELQHRTNAYFKISFELQG